MSGVLPIVPDDDQCGYTWRRPDDTFRYHCTKSAEHTGEHEFVTPDGRQISPRIGDHVLVGSSPAFEQQCKLTWQPSDHSEWVRCGRSAGHGGAHEHKGNMLTRDPEYIKTVPHRWDGVAAPLPKRKPWAGNQYERTADYLDSVGISPMEIVIGTLDINGYDRLVLDENGKRVRDRRPDRTQDLMTEHYEWPDFATGLHAVDLFIQDGGWKENQE